MSEIKIEKYQREGARWTILRILDAGRPFGVNEGVIVRVLSDTHLSSTVEGVRRELEYLQALKLVEVGQDDDVWWAKLTAQGVDVVEYVAPAPAGIARPAKRVS